MTIIHIYADTNGNWGDKALALGTQNIFKKYLGISQFKIISDEVVPFHREELKTADLIIYGGGGIATRFVRNYNDFFGGTKAPIIAYGIGLNYFRMSNGIEPDLDLNDAKLFEKISKQTTYFSVRNDGTHEKLLRFGIDLPESPDPGMWCSLNQNLVRPEPRKYVCIQLAGDQIFERFLYNDLCEKDFLDQIVEVTRYLNNQNVLVQFPLHRREDAFIYSRLFKPKSSRLSFGTQNVSSEKILPWDWDYNITRIPLGLSYYKYPEFVIGMRGHSQIIPFGMRVPPIAISSQNKNYEFMRKVGLEEYCLDIKSPKISKAIISLIEKLENNHPKVQNQINSQIDLLSKGLDEEFRIIKEKLGW